MVLISHNSSKETQQFITLLGNTGHLLIPSKIRGYLNPNETKTSRRGKFCVGNKIFRRWLVFATADTHNLALLRIQLERIVFWPPVKGSQIILEKLKIRIIINYTKKKSIIRILENFGAEVKMEVININIERQGPQHWALRHTGENRNKIGHFAHEKPPFDDGSK